MVRIEGSFAILLAVLGCQSTTTTAASPDESNEAGGATSSVAAFGGEGGSDPGTEVATAGGNAPAPLTSRTASGGTRATLASSTHRGGSSGVTAATASSSLGSGGTSVSSSTLATGGITFSTPVSATGGSLGTGGTKAGTTREPDGCHDWEMISKPGEPATLQDVGLCYESGGGLGRNHCEPGGVCSFCELSGRYRTTLDCDRDGICETSATTKDNCGACGNVCDSVCEPNSYSEWYSCRI